MVYAPGRKNATRLTIIFTFPMDRAYPGEYETRLSAELPLGVAVFLDFLACQGKYQTLISLPIPWCYLSPDRQTPKFSLWWTNCISTMFLFVPRGSTSQQAVKDTRPLVPVCYLFPDERTSNSRLWIEIWLLPSLSWKATLWDCQMNVFHFPLTCKIMVCKK